VVAVEIAKFTDAESTGEEKLHDGFVSQADRVFDIDCSDDPLGFFTR